MVQYTPVRSEKPWVTWSGVHHLLELVGFQGESNRRVLEGPTYPPWSHRIPRIGRFVQLGCVFLESKPKVRLESEHVKRIISSWQPSRETPEVLNETPWLWLILRSQIDVEQSSNETLERRCWPCVIFCFFCFAPFFLELKFLGPTASTRSTAPHPFFVKRAVAGWARGSTCRRPSESTPTTSSAFGTGPRASDGSVRTERRAKSRCPSGDRRCRSA